MERGERKKKEHKWGEYFRGLIHCWSGRDFKLKVCGTHGLVYGSKWEAETEKGDGWGRRRKRSGRGRGKSKEEWKRWHKREEKESKAYTWSLKEPKNQWVQYQFKEGREKKIMRKEQEPLYVLLCDMSLSVQL